MRRVCPLLCIGFVCFAFVTVAHETEDDSIRTLESIDDMPALRSYSQPKEMRATKMLDLAQRLQLPRCHLERIKRATRLTDAGCRAQRCPSDTLELLQEKAVVPNLAGLVQDKQIGQIIGETLAQGADPTNTDVSIRAVLDAITALQGKIQREKDQDSDQQDHDMKLCRRTNRDLTRVVGDAETAQKAANTKQFENREQRKQARLDLQNSLDRQRQIEKALHKVRTALREAQDSYYARRLKRKKDITVLQGALKLVCTFRSFKDDDRCVEHKLAFAVSDPTKSAIFAGETTEMLTAEHDKFLVEQKDAWPKQVEKDTSDIAKGIPPNDAASESAPESLLEYTKNSAAARLKLDRLLQEGASPQVEGPVQAVLLAVKAGDYTQSSGLLQLVLQLIKQLEEQQHQDQQKYHLFHRESLTQVQVQEEARREELRLQEEMKNTIDTCSNNIEQGVLEFFSAVRVEKGAQESQRQNSVTCEEQLQKYQARQALRDEDLVNINKLRSLLLVLDGTYGTPSCDKDDQDDCTKASQGMCVYKSFDDKECACEHGFSGLACAERKCKGSDGRMLDGRDADVCSGSTRGSCDQVTGNCKCKDGYKHGPHNACELSKYCPEGRAGGNCNGHGKCNQVTAQCSCDEGYFGSDCRKKKCPGGAVDNLKYSPKDPEACSGHGVCLSDSGTCGCYDTFTGPKCTKRTCRKNCSGKGKCNAETGKCVCEKGATGPTCELFECEGGCGGSGGECDAATGKCICKDGNSGPNCKRSTACDVKETTYHDWAMFREGWSKCPYGSLMTGIKRGSCDGLHCLEQAQCAKPCLGEERLQLGHCYQANWWTALNSAGKGGCEDGYFMAGLYRSKCLSLYCLQMGWCCSVMDSGYGNCGVAIWQEQLSKDNSWATVPMADVGGAKEPQGFMTAMSRAGRTATLSDLKEVSYCNFKRLDTNED